MKNHRTVDAVSFKRNLLSGEPQVVATKTQRAQRFIKGTRSGLAPFVSLRFTSFKALLAGCALLWLMSLNAFADDAPGWLRQAASVTTPAYGKNVAAVVLLNERSIKVEEDGKMTTVERYAVKILTSDGSQEARGAAVYMTDTGKVKDIRAWVIHPSGEVKKLGKDETLDLAIAQNDVYNEARIKAISATGEVEPGAIFGYEYTAEERSVFTQFDWNFQEDLPTLVSRFSLSLPVGWHAESVMFNHPKLDPMTTGTNYTWELKNLGHIEDEPAAPSPVNLAPRLAVSYFPAEGKAMLGRSFTSWADVSDWLTNLSIGQDAVSEPLAAKAKQLTANAKTEYEKIQLIGRFVQSVNYISIQTGLGRGGGYRPHAASDVFAKAYGDCKDKANLMKAMLKAIGINSFLVSIYSGDPTYVREEWPSPQQFNHCIIAVNLTEATNAPTVIEHAKLGKLLIFDPTDDNTPVGDLPDHEQNSFALIIAGADGALMRMPITPPEANKMERTIDVELGAGGEITAKLREESIGQASVDERRRFRGLSRPDYLKMIEKWIVRGVSGASVKKAEPTDSPADGKFLLDVEFASPHYGQLMQGKLLIFKPAVVSRRESIFLTESSRKHPVLLNSEAYTETVRVKLPEGFAVDELPDAVKMETAFGIYYTSYEVKDGTLHFTRKMILRGAIIPPGEYARVKEFFARMRAAEQAPVVLARK
ncbi:MAG: DUF3857 and transglutaminase domain-containing protein [Acidobacteriota bacterium]